jgi:GMP synthase C terminal domain.
MRPVNSTEAMTANFAEIDQGMLAGLWRKFEAEGAGSLWYDVTHKPPEPLSGVILRFNEQKKLPVPFGYRAFYLLRICCKILLLLPSRLHDTISNTTSERTMGIIAAILSFFLIFFSACGDTSSKPETKMRIQVLLVSSKKSRLHAPDKLEENEICDPRDFKVYRTTEIGALIWTAENLRYKVEGSRCFRDQDSNCIKFGRLYNWAQAMDIKSYYLRNTAEDSIHKPYHQGSACRAGTS